jgi:hypothetical protein
MAGSVPGHASDRSRPAPDPVVLNGRPGRPCGLRPTSQCDAAAGGADGYAAAVSDVLALDRLADGAAHQP